MTKNDVDVKDIMKNKWEAHKSDLDGPYSKTTQFMLQSLDLNISTLVVKAFVNAFIDDSNHEHEYICPIFILFRMGSKKEWNIVYEQLTNNINYINDYNVGQDEDGDLIMIVFSVPERFRTDYQNFRGGKYSRFSKEYRRKFPRFIVNQNKKEESTIWKILNKSDELKRQLEDDYGLDEGYLDKQDEIWDAPRKETEVFNYIKQKENA